MENNILEKNILKISGKEVSKVDTRNRKQHEVFRIDVNLHKRRIIIGVYGDNNCRTQENRLCVIYVVNTAPKYVCSKYFFLLLPTSYSLSVLCLSGT